MISGGTGILSRGKRAADLLLDQKGMPPESACSVQGIGVFIGCEHEKTETISKKVI